MLIHPHLPAFDFFASVRGRFVKSSAKPGSHRQTLYLPRASASVQCWAEMNNLEPSLILPLARAEPDYNAPADQTVFQLSSAGN